MGFGGPAAGYMTTREAFKRNMPGRIIGVSVDRLGNKALRMALQMREQHIKRERATSNICTASALMASMTGFYCVYNGPERAAPRGETAHLAAATVARALEAMDYRLASKEFFDTLEVEAGQPSCSRWRSNRASTSTIPPKGACACRSTR